MVKKDIFLAKYFLKGYYEMAAPFIVLGPRISRITRILKLFYSFFKTASPFNVAQSATQIRVIRSIDNIKIVFLRCYRTPYGRFVDKKIIA